MKTAAFASALVLASILSPVSSPAADAPKPLRVLLLTGGCCHDYAKQKDILKAGLEARANIVVDQVHTDDKSTKPPLAHFGTPTTRRATTSSSTTNAPPISATRPRSRPSSRRTRPAPPA